MPKGRSLHVGVNKPAFNVTELHGCRGDAEAMHNLAATAGFQAKTLVDGAATFEAVNAEILDAAGELEAGDIFLFTFSGHGSFAESSDPADDFQDEVILLQDCLVPDNYVRFNWWSQFKEEVRILGIADCCHSGTVFVASLIPMDSIDDAANAVSAVAAVAGFGELATPIAAASMSAMPRPIRQTRRTDGELNRGITARDRDAILAVSRDLNQELLSSPESDLKAMVLTLAACRDHELAKDGPQNGAFTERLIAVWNEGQFPGDNYNDFITAIRTPFNGATSRQHPNLNDRFAGHEHKFVNQRPFTI